MFYKNYKNLPQKRAENEKAGLKQAALDLNEVSLAQTQQTADLTEQIANLEALVMAQQSASSDSSAAK